MAGWHHQFNRNELGNTLGDGEGQGGLVCCNLWHRRVGHDLATEQQTPRMWSVPTPSQLQKCLWVFQSPLLQLSLSLVLLSTQTCYTHFHMCWSLIYFLYPISTSESVLLGFIWSASSLRTGTLSVWLTLIACCIPQCLEHGLKGAWLMSIEQINEWEDSHLFSQRRVYEHGWILHFFTIRDYRGTIRKVIQRLWSKNAAKLWTTPTDNLSCMPQFQFLVFPQKQPVTQVWFQLILTFLQTTWRRHMSNYLYFLNDKTED